MNNTLTRLERDASRILEDLLRLELLDVTSVAKLLRTSKKFVRHNFPIVVLGPKSHRIRRVDVEAFQAKRTLRPNGKEAA